MLVVVGIVAIVCLAMATVIDWGDKEPDSLPENGQQLSNSTTLETLAAGTIADPLSSGGFGPEMVLIPEGQFQMGCLVSPCEDRELPVREVIIPHALAVSKYEITFADWGRCVNAGGCRNYMPEDNGWGGGNRPVINVDWQDAREYVSWLSEETGKNYRLLTEAEWEYAARAGSESIYSWGNDIGVNQANCNGCGSTWDGESTAPVGSFSPNDFELHDMHGNVWEWVADCWNGDYVGAPLDGSAWQDGNCQARTLRGGAFYVAHGSISSSVRIWAAQDTRASSDGLRVAYSLN